MTFTEWTELPENTRVVPFTDFHPTVSTLPKRDDSDLEFERWKWEDR